MKIHQALRGDGSIGQMTNNIQVKTWSWLSVHLNCFHSDYPIKFTPLWTLKLKAMFPMTVKKARSDFKYLISKKLWKFKGLSYTWIFKGGCVLKPYTFSPENTDYFLPCQIIKDMNGWYEKWGLSWHKMGHRWERTLKKAALEKIMPAMATQMELSLHRKQKKQNGGFIIFQTKHITLPCKRITLD